MELDSLWFIGPAGLILALAFSLALRERREFGQMWTRVYAAAIFCVASSGAYATGLFLVAA